MMNRELDVIVVGGGAGGAAAAMELSRRRLRVAVLERGDWYRGPGRFWRSLSYYDVHPLTKLPGRSREGLPVWRSFSCGGTTMVSCGNGVPSMVSELKAEHFDMSLEMKEAQEELRIVCSDALLSRTSRAVIEAGEALGHHFELMPKFIDPDRCQRCGLCIWACPHGAKWSATRMLRSACESGAQLLRGVEIDEIITSNGQARGVSGRSQGRPFKAFAPKVVLAAGGLVSPALLQRAGIGTAGKQLFVDLFINTYGTVRGLDLAHEPSMATVCTQHHESDGFILSPFAAHSRVLRFVESGVRGLVAPREGYVGLMAKIRDDMEGEVYPDGSYSKRITAADQAKLDAGRGLSRQILQKMGASRRSIFSSKVGSAHPGGGAAIGKVVDRNLETEIKNLHVCDCSVFPEAPGLPPILGIVAMGKKLGKTLEA
jgi:choline dehydrogenase-like flavoprotein